MMETFQSKVRLRCIAGLDAVRCPSATVRSSPASPICPRGHVTSRPRPSRC